MSAKDSMVEFLEAHPRMIGVLFTVLMLLSQAGMVMAEGGTGGGTTGP